VSHTGGELERRPETVPAPYLHGQRTGDIVRVVDWPEFAAWARVRGVPIGGLILIAAQLVWKSVFLSHYYFWQDDFHFLELAREHSFTWNYLTYVGAGHLTPGDYAIFWAVARTSPYNWGFAAGITVVLLAAAGVAALRLMRTLFGDRPAILVPLAIYLLTPLTMPDIRWWSSGMESLPLQIATFMALNAQVHYVRTRRFWHAIAATAWVLVGLVFFEKGVALPLLLLAVTSAFLMEGNWAKAIGRSLQAFWREWVIQVVVVAAWAALLVYSLHTSSTQPGTPGSAGGVVTFIVKLVKDTFVPGAIGGPWQWLPSGDSEFAYSAPPSALAWLALIVAALVIAVSIWHRRYAWRAWAILAGWVAAADIAPVLLGRISELGPSVLGLETRYVADAAPILAICVGLAFWPVTGQPDRTRRRTTVPGADQFWRMVAAGLVGAFVIGSVWSVQAFQTDTSSAPVRLYMANARAALAEAPAGTVIEDGAVPPTLMTGLFGTYYVRASKVLGVLGQAAHPAGVRWTEQPAGTIDHLMVFGSDGRLHEASVWGKPSVPRRGCQAVRHGRAVVRFTAATWSSTRVLRVAYLAANAVGGQDVTVSYGASSQQLTLRAGLHSAWFIERGSTTSVTFSGPAMRGLCVGSMAAGVIVPSASGTVIPVAF
jgi:hypothetical protein